MMEVKNYNFGEKQSIWMKEVKNNNFGEKEANLDEGSKKLQFCRKRGEFG